MKKENKIPKFKTIMEESDFWDENSPLDLFDESDLKEVEFQVQKKSPEKIYLYWLPARREGRAYASEKRGRGKAIKGE